MTDADHVWTHISPDQAAGRACVMCGRATGEPGWSGVVVGRADEGGPVYACSGGDGRGEPGPDGRRATGRDCAEQTAFVVPDSPEGLEL